MYDKALDTLPNFTKMPLHEAKQAFCDWADETWDFNKKIESFKYTVREKAYSTYYIQKIANSAVLSGIDYKMKAMMNAKNL